MGYLGYPVNSNSEYSIKIFANWRLRAVNNIYNISSFCVNYFMVKITAYLCMVSVYISSINSIGFDRDSGLKISLWRTTVIQTRRKDRRVGFLKLLFTMLFLSKIVLSVFYYHFFNYQDQRSPVARKLLSFTDIV